MAAFTAAVSFMAVTDAEGVLTIIRFWHETEVAWNSELQDEPNEPMQPALMLAACKAAQD